MVRLTRLNGTVVHLNADLIATVEEHHDTVIGLVDGKTVVVRETAAEVVAEIIAYRGAVLAAGATVPGSVQEQPLPTGEARLVVLPTPFPETGSEADASSPRNAKDLT